MLEQETHVPADVILKEQGDEFLLKCYLNVISGFLLGPLAAEIAAMLRRRRLTHADPNPPPLTRDQYFDSQLQPRIVLEVVNCCTVWEDENGNMMTSFSKKDDEPPIHEVSHDFRYVERNTEEIAVKVRTPLGMASALVSKNVKAGDSILILRDQVHGPQAPITGLVV